MKKTLLLLTACVILVMSSCATRNYRHNDLRGYHYGKGHKYSGKYHGAGYKYNWERKQ